MISLKYLTLDYADKRVLDGFSLDIPAEGITCLHGPSGCGKTTLLRILAGLQSPDSGLISGKPKQPALLFQEDRLLPHFTAFENLAAVLPKARACEAGLWLRRVGLGKDQDLKPGALSGGMKRRVALARALAYGGDFLLLDEPFTGLDAALAEEMAALIRNTGIPALVVTHSREEIEHLGGRFLTVSGPPLCVTGS